MKSRISTAQNTTNSDVKEVLAALNKDPKAGIELLRGKLKESRRSEKEKVRFMALSSIEREREQVRLDAIKKAVLSLTENLVPASELCVDVNYSEESNLPMLAEAAFNSSLKSDILWLSDSKMNPSFKIKAVTTKLTVADYTLFDSALKKLVKYSGLEKSLKDVASSNLMHAIGFKAFQFEGEARKLKSSDEYLELLVSKSIAAKLNYNKYTAKKADVAQALAMAVAEVGIELGFKKTRMRSVTIDCSDSKFSSTDIDRKTMTETCQKIIDGSSCSGRLTSKSDALDLLNGLISHLLY